jgi:hypothetical protein
MSVQALKFLFANRDGVFVELEVLSDIKVSQLKAYLIDAWPEGALQRIAALVCKKAARWLIHKRRAGEQRCPSARTRAGYGSSAWASASCRTSRR